MRKGNNGKSRGEVDKRNAEREIGQQRNKKQGKKEAINIEGRKANSKKKTETKEVRIIKRSKNSKKAREVITEQEEIGSSAKIRDKRNRVRRRKKEIRKVVRKK